MKCFIPFLMFTILFSCKTTNQATLSQAQDSSPKVLYWKLVNRGNDDLIARGNNPAETQHTTALLEFIVYDLEGELFLDYIFYSPAFPEIRRQVEVGIDSGYAIRQIHSTGRILPTNFATSPIINKNTREIRIQRGVTRSILGIDSVEKDGFLGVFRKVSRGAGNIGTNSISLKTYSNFKIKSKNIAGLDAPAFQVDFSGDKRNFYSAAYQTSIKLADRGYENKNFYGQFAAHGRQVLNVTNRRAFNKKSIYGPINLGQVNADLSDGITRQNVLWRYAKGTITLRPIALSMQSMGRMSPKQVPYGMLAPIVTTSSLEKDKLATKLFETANKAALKRINDFAAQAEKMMAQPLNDTDD